MNAIITLNHFCDIHGPQVIFTTQTLRDQFLIDAKIDELKSSTNNDYKSPCGGCSSIGNKLIFKTEDKESTILFVSSEKTLFGAEILSLLKSTALRSLSCEVSFHYYQIDKFIDLSILSNISDNIRKCCVLWKLSIELVELHVQGQRFTSERIRKIVFDRDCHERQNVSSQYSTISIKKPQRGF